MAKILCIDDDQDVLDTCQFLLKEQGHTVETATNGKAGYAKAKTVKPELIVLDVMMEDQTAGFHAAYNFRNDDSLKHTPILMLTSVNQKTGMKFDPKKDGEFLPVDAFIEKPILREKFLATVSKLLALSKSQINVGKK